MLDKRNKNIYFFSKQYRFIYSVISKRLCCCCVSTKFIENIAKRLKGLTIGTVIYSELWIDENELSNDDYQVKRDDILMIKSNYLKAVSENFSYDSLRTLKEKGLI